MHALGLMLNKPSGVHEFQCLEESIKNGKKCKPYSILHKD